MSTCSEIYVMDIVSLEITRKRHGNQQNEIEIWVVVIDLDAQTSIALITARNPLNLMYICLKIYVMVVVCLEMIRNGLKSTKLDWNLTCLHAHTHVFGMLPTHTIEIWGPLMSTCLELKCDGRSLLGNDQKWLEINKIRLICCEILSLLLCFGPHPFSPHL